MNGNLPINDHEELVPAGIEPHQARLPPYPAIKASPAPNQVEHAEALVAADGQRQLPGGMNGEIVDSLLVNSNGLEEDEGISIVDADGAVGVGGDEVAGEGEAGRGEEGEGGDGGGVVVEGTEGGGGGEVVEMDGVVGASGGGSGAGGGGGCDGGEVGRVGEERG